MWANLKSIKFSVLRKYFFGKKKENIPVFVATILFSAFSALTETILIFSIIVAFSVLNGEGFGPLENVQFLSPLLHFLKTFNSSTLFLLLIGLGVFSQIVRAILTFLARVKTTHLGLRIQTALQQDIYNQMLQLSYATVMKYPAGVLSELTRTPTNIVQPTIEQLSELFANTMFVFLSIILMLKLSPILTLFSGCIFALYFLVQKKILEKISNNSVLVTDKLNQLSSLTVQFVSGIRIIHAFNRQFYVRRSVKKTLFSIAKYQLRTTQLTQGGLTLIEILVSLIVCGIIFLGFLVFQIGIDPTALPLMLGFLGVAHRLGGRVQLVSSGLSILLSSVGPFELISQFLGSNENENLPTQSKEAIPFNDKIEIKNLSFSYTSTPEEKALNQISFNVPHGETVAIVGRSGSGKSTLMDILLGLYQSTEGSILIDGVPLTLSNASAWRNRLSVVHQDPFVLNTSVRENLLFGKANASIEEMREATRLAHADVFIDKLPEGYDTVIGERGHKLSGGERQRLTLAQALIRKPDVLILDEATSHLDTASEAFIQDSIKSLPKDMTVFIVAHRLSTIKYANKIIVMHKGKISELGTHAELLAEKGEYHNFWATQQRA